MAKINAQPHPHCHPPNPVPCFFYWFQIIASHRLAGVGRHRINPILVSDSHKAHHGAQVRDFLAQSTTQHIRLDGGCTPIYQPCDTHWVIPFKRRYAKGYQQWMREGKKDFTRLNNLRKMSYKKVCELVLDACKVTDILEIVPPPGTP